MMHALLGIFVYCVLARVTYELLKTFTEDFDISFYSICVPIAFPIALIGFISHLIRPDPKLLYRRRMQALEWEEILWNRQQKILKMENQFDLDSMDKELKK
jgi:hypothetical protein